jgi:hypothetical protein
MNINSFPNPFDENISIKLNLPAGFNEKIKIAIYDEKGIQVKYFEKENYTSVEPVVLSELNQLTSGIYFCEIKAGEKFKTIKVIKKK